MKKVFIVLAENEKEQGWGVVIRNMLRSSYDIEILDDINSAVDRLTVAGKEDYSPAAVISDTMQDHYEEVYRAAGNIPFILLTADKTREDWKKLAEQKGYGVNFSVFMKEDFSDGNPFVDHFETAVNPISRPPEVIK